MTTHADSRGREAARLISEISSTIIDQHPYLKPYRAAAPEAISDEDLLIAYQHCDGKEDAIYQKISSWWNDLSDNRAVQGQSTSWEQVSHKKKAHEESKAAADKTHDHDRKNRGRSAPPTRGGRGAGRGGRANSVGPGRGGRGGRGKQHTTERAAQNSTQHANDTAAKTNDQNTPDLVNNTTAKEEAPKAVAEQPSTRPQDAEAAASTAASSGATWSAWGSGVSFADVVKKQPNAQPPQPEPAAEVEQFPGTVDVQVDRASLHPVEDDSEIAPKRNGGKTRGRGGRGGRGNKGMYRPKDRSAAPQAELPLEDGLAEPAGAEHQIRLTHEADQQPQYEVPVEDANEARQGYLKMGKWDSSMTSPDVGAFQFGSFGEYEAGAVPPGWNAGEQLTANAWEVETTEAVVVEQTLPETEATHTNGGVGSLFDGQQANSVQDEESHMHQNGQHATQPPGFDSPDVNAPPGLGGLQHGKQELPGRHRGNQGGRNFQGHANQRGQAQHQMPQQPPQQLPYGHPYGLSMGMGEVPGNYMAYMGPGGFAGAVSNAAPAPSTSSATVAGTGQASVAPGMAHMQQPYGAPPPGMMPGSTGPYNPYYPYYHQQLFYQQAPGYYNQRQQAMYQPPRGGYMPYEQPTTASMYGQYDGMYSMQSAPHSGPAPSNKGAGSKGGSAPAQHHATTAAPDMSLNASTAHPSYPFYGGREPWYNQQSWGGHTGAAYPQSSPTAGSTNGAAFSQARK